MDFQKQRVCSCLLNFTNTDEIAQEQSHAQSKGHEYVRQLIQCTTCSKCFCNKSVIINLYLETDTADSLGSTTTKQSKHL